MQALSDLLTLLEPWAGPIGGVGGALVTIVGIVAKQRADARKSYHDSAVEQRTFTQAEREELIRAASEYRKELKEDLDRAAARLDECERSREEQRQRIDAVDQNLRVSMMRIGELELQVRSLGAGGTLPKAFRDQGPQPPP